MKPSLYSLRGVLLLCSVLAIVLTTEGQNGFTHPFPTLSAGGEPHEHKSQVCLHHRSTLSLSRADGEYGGAYAPRTGSEQDAL